VGTETPARRVLGIVGCEVLADEIAYVISRDDNVSSVVVGTSPESDELYEKLRRLAPSKTIALKAEGEIGPAILDDGTSIVVKVMPIALHQGPAELRERVLVEIGKLEKNCGSVLVFYGLCGNAFKEIDRLSENFKVPVTILRDGKKLIVDDCVGAELGGTEEYLAYLKSEHGEYPLNSMWAQKWRHYMHETQLLRDENDLEEAKMVFRCMGYSKVAKLDTGLVDDDDFEAKVKEFATLFELQMERVKCPLRVVEESYQAAIRLLE
jgi:hypothetical protein